MNKTARQNAFQSAVKALAVVAPVALMAYAFEVSPDCVDRTQIFQICGRVAEVMVGNSGFRVSYFFGIQKAVDYLRSCFAEALAA